jgi:hypothetical protein
MFQLGSFRGRLTGALNEMGCSVDYFFNAAFRKADACDNCLDDSD